MRFVQCISFTFLLLCTTGATAVAQRVDQLFPVKGTPVSGIVTEMSPTEIMINVRGTNQKFSVLDIKRLTFADDPREFTTARDKILSGEWESGLEQLKKVDGSAITRDFVTQDLAFFNAYALAKMALAGNGDKDAASQALMTYARNASKNFHFTEAAELLGALAIEREKYDEAARFYAYLAKTAKEAGWPEYAMKVAVWEGRVLEAQGNYPEALAKYEAVIGATNNSPEGVRQKNFAMIGKASALAETGQVDEGLKLINEVVEKNSSEDTELFGRAYNAQGRCFIKADKANQALLAFLRVDLLFNEHPDIHAEALYYLNKLWTSTNKADRAAAARNTLAQRYTASRWMNRN